MLVRASGRKEGTSDVHPGFGTSEITYYADKRERKAIPQSGEFIVIMKVIVEVERML